VFGTTVSVDDLFAHLEDEAWAIVDCRHLLQDFAAGRRMYQAAHIPGAFYAHGEEDLAGPKTGRNGRHPMPDPERFAAFLRELGVNDDTQIVAYDAGADMWAARFWFVCRSIGHDAVAVLDGGFAAWTAMGKPVSAQTPARPGNGNIQARPRSELAVDASDVLQSLESKAFSLIDARGADRFRGENETIDPVGGHIPGAINRPFRSNYTGPFGQFKPAQDLRKEFEAIGIAPERIVHQCGSGVSAAVNLLAMEIAGLRGARLYPGSWSEWSSDRSRPMVTREST
jgi:thiosulfate/3-mercaptopyruvate sulfurtransferase